MASVRAVGGGGAAGTAGDLLLSIPAVEAHSVTGGQQTLLERGRPLNIRVIERAPAPAPAAGAAAGRGQGCLYPELYGSDGEGEGCTIVASVGGTSWQLKPESQTLRIGDVSYVFSLPDQPGTYYTVTLAADASPESLGMLEAVLEAVTLYRESDALLSDPEAAAGEAALAGSAEREYKRSLAKGVHSVSKMLASGMLASATYASNAISSKAAAMTPEQPTDTPVNVSPSLKKRFRQTEKLAGRVSGAVEGVVSGLAWAGAKVAGGVLKLAGADKPLKPGEEPGFIREVGHAAITGFASVWNAMEEAGRIVLLSARDNTASVVKQKYGPDAAEVSTSAANAAGFSAQAAYRGTKIGVRTVAKAAAKKTAKGVIVSWAGTEGGGAASGSGGRPPVTAAKIT